MQQGTTTAIVGPSGSGKTTICHLIARFYDVQAGSITIGGIDIRRLTFESLLQHISILVVFILLWPDYLPFVNYCRP